MIIETPRSKNIPVTLVEGVYESDPLFIGITGKVCLGLSMSEAAPIDLYMGPENYLAKRESLAMDLGINSITISDEAVNTGVKITSLVPFFLFYTPEGVWNNPFEIAPVSVNPQ